MNLETKKNTSNEKNKIKNQWKIKNQNFWGSQNTNPNIVNIRFKRESLNLSDSTRSDFYKREEPARK